MRTILTTLNAKYIHASLALRWLYVANKDAFDIGFKEYTIKEEIEAIGQDLLATKCDCVGLGVYIWNIEKIKDLISYLRLKKPDLILILGGPEVSYEPAYFLQQLPIDYVISGEGEFVLGELLYALENNKNISINGVSSLREISNAVARADIEKLVQLPSPYQLPEDIESRSKRLTYFETSRGCPYQCSYCLSSIEKGVRYFPENYVKENLLYLIQNGAEQIKFLDRTFNLNWRKSRPVFDFLIENYREGLSCQFEIYPDLLSDEIIDYLHSRLPANYFRFEIGIQSTFEQSNKAVKRKQNFNTVSQNINKLVRGGKIDLHLDLIAGLPYESYERFAQSVNSAFAFRAKEFQLGFLKLLRGTQLRKDAAKYNYLYQEQAPYEVISHNDLSVDDLNKIRKVEKAIDKYWNSGRFAQSLKALFDIFYRNRYFEFFLELAEHEEAELPENHSLEDLYAFLYNFLTDRNIYLPDAMRNDYYSNFSIRPTTAFWADTIPKKERKRLLLQICADSDFLLKNKLTEYNILKQTTIDHLWGNKYLLTVFLPEGRKQMEVNG
ncbi:MAG: DUF4080 domain-containing protein [Bacteroidales bacterium]|nr:DUF4080 domain-containing protein [Bacteroidales bacterium]